MINLSYDLHLHSCLSPCSDNSMTPQNIVAMASLKELDVIALTDHNSCKNCASIISVSKYYGLTVIPGMELTTLEEVHVLCLFYSLEGAMAFDEYVSSHLVPIPNNEKIFGEQLIWGPDDTLLGRFPNLLINSTDISIDELYSLLKLYQGIMIPAHIDKSSTSIISNLGFVPPDSQFTCVELQNINSLNSLYPTNPYLRECNIIFSSDAHQLEDINEPIHTLQVKDRSIKSILDCLSNNVSHLNCTTENSP